DQELGLVDEGGREYRGGRRLQALLRRPCVGAALWQVEDGQFRPTLTVFVVIEEQVERVTFGWRKIRAQVDRRVPARRRHVGVEGTVRQSGVDRNGLVMPLPLDQAEDERSRAEQPAAPPASAIVVFQWRFDFTETVERVERAVAVAEIKTPLHQILAASGFDLHAGAAGLVVGGRE